MLHLFDASPFWFVEPGSKTFFVFAGAEMSTGFTPENTGEIIMETFVMKPGKEVGIIKNAIREAI